MITLTKSGDTINFTFSNSDHYLYGNGTISVPTNSLSLTIDESDMVTFKKTNNDIFISATLGEFNKTKAELIEFYKDNMVGGGGMSSGDVESMISSATSGKADTSAVTESLNAKVDTSAFTSYSGSIESRLSNDEEVTAAALNDLNETISGKVDTSAVTTSVTSSSTDAEIPTAKAVYDAIPTGGTSITIDQTLDSGSTNPVANSAVSAALNHDDMFLYRVDAERNWLGRITGNLQLRWRNPYDGVSRTTQNAITLMKINNIPLIKDNGITNLNLVETSAIVTAMTNSSTDSEIPSAKAVYDRFGGMKIQQITQSAYSAMEQAGTLDNSTLYIVIDS